MSGRPRVLIGVPNLFYLDAGLDMRLGRERVGFIERLRLLLFPTSWLAIRPPELSDVMDD